MMSGWSVAGIPGAGQLLVTERETPFAGLVALGGVGDADAGRGGELEDRAVAFKPKTFGGDEILAVEGAVDLKELGQPAGTACALDTANQHRLRTSFNACHDVQHFVHPVAEIDVGATAGRMLINMLPRMGYGS